MGVSNITRFPGGVSNVSDGNVFNNLKFPDFSNYHLLFDDFDKYTAAQWSVGGVNPVAPALAAGDGGILSMATTGASGDSNFVQQAANSFFVTQATGVVAGKAMGFRARGQVDNATLGLLAFGLQIPVAANNFLTPADGIFLRKPAADTNVYLVHRVGNAETLSAALGTIADATPFEVSFFYDGTTNIVAALNGTVKASITVPTLTAVGLRVTAGVQANSAAARTLLLDQLVAFKER